MSPKTAVLDKKTANSYTPTNARETLSVSTDKCGTVRGQIKSPFMEKGYRPTANSQQPTANYINCQKIVSTI